MNLMLILSVINNMSFRQYMSINRFLQMCKSLVYKYDTRDFLLMVKRLHNRAPETIHEAPSKLFVRHRRNVLCSFDGA